MYKIEVIATDGRVFGLGRDPNTRGPVLLPSDRMSPWAKTEMVSVINWLENQTVCGIHSVQLFPQPNGRKT